MSFEFEVIEGFETPNIKISELNEAGAAFLNKLGVETKTAEAFKIGSDDKGRIIYPCYSQPDNDGKSELCDLKLQTTDGIAVKMERGKYKQVLFGSHLCSPEVNETINFCFSTYDALITYQIGLKNCVSAAHSDSKFSFIRHQFEFLKKFKKIVFAPVVEPDAEKDKEAKEDLKKIITRLGHGKSFIVRKADMLDCKTISELATKHGNEAVKNAFEKALHTPDPDFVYLADVDDEELKPGVPFGFAEIDRCTNGAQYGDLVLVTGKLSDGKTTTVLNMTKSFVEHGETVFLYSIEQGMDKIRTKLELMFAGPEYNECRKMEKTFANRYKPLPSVLPYIRNYYRKHIVNLIGKGHLKIDQFLEKAQYAVDRFGCTVIVVDNLMTFTEGSGDGKYNLQSDIAAKLKRFAVENDVIVILLAHHKDRRDESIEPVLSDILGSSETYGRADTIIQLYKITSEIAEKRPELSNYNAVFLLSKVRDGGMLTSVRMLICDENSERIYEAWDYKRQHARSKWQTLETDKLLEEAKIAKAAALKAKHETHVEEMFTIPTELTEDEKMMF